MAEFEAERKRKSRGARFLGRIGRSWQICSPIAPPPKHREDFADKIESKLLTLHAVNGRDTHVAWGRKRENAREEERG